MNNPFALAFFGALVSMAVGPLADRIVVWLYKLRRNRD